MKEAVTRRLSSGVPGDALPQLEDFSAVAKSARKKAFETALLAVRGRSSGPLLGRVLSPDADPDPAAQIPSGDFATVKKSSSFGVPPATTRGDALQKDSASVVFPMLPVPPTGIFWWPLLLLEIRSLKGRRRRHRKATIHLQSSGKFEV
ncbi:hypothetical protein GOP47_0029268 [Adiantum capillus-veneris]|nr:hypothetical protein GOP47_0029268 [Adiantum capillus-veneris]